VIIKDPAELQTLVARINNDRIICFVSFILFIGLIRSAWWRHGASREGWAPISCASDWKWKID